jgi:hypothetical protein
MLDSGMPILGYQDFVKQDLCGNTQIPYFSCDLPRRTDNGIRRFIGRGIFKVSNVLLSSDDACLNC